MKDTPLNENIQALISEIKQLSEKISQLPLRCSDITQLERDLCNLKANTYMLEIKIEHIESTLKEAKQVNRPTNSENLNTLRKEAQEPSVESHLPRLRP